MKTLLKLCFVLVLMAGSIAVTQAQSTKKQKKANEIKTLVNGVNYVFVANYVMPQQGVGRALNTDYDLTVTKDTITSYLPYFGRAYIAPTNPYSADGFGIKFKSTNFNYNVTEIKKGSWEVVIKPKSSNISDMTDVQTLRLSIYDNGYATLYVNSTNREPISFNGTIEAIAKK
jgi:hypothetical protein